MPDTQISEPLTQVERLRLAIALTESYDDRVFEIEPECVEALLKEYDELKDKYNKITIALSGHVVGWRTMDSAPRDGTPFLAWESEDRGPFKCWWYFDWPHDEAYWTDYADSEPDPKYWAPIPAPPVQGMEG